MDKIGKSRVHTTVMFSCITKLQSSVGNIMNIFISQKKKSAVNNRKRLKKEETGCQIEYK